MNDGARENQSLIPCEWNQALVLYARRVLRDIFSQWRVGDVWGRTTGMRWEKWLGTACFFVASLFYPIILRNFAYNNL